MAEAGELELIRVFRTMMPGESDGIIRSVGDDCFAVESFGGDLMISTIDTFIEDIHFKRDFATYEQTGRRCMAAAVSDIAAMAGTPVYSLVSMSLPGDFLFDDAVGMFVGMQNTAQLYGCPIVGGETTSTNGSTAVSVTVIGRVAPDSMIIRSGAQVGDAVYVSGTLGDAMAGLLALEKGDSGFERLTEAFLFPAAQVHLAQTLARHYDITAMIDLSDGLSSDLAHICEESGCGAVIWEDTLPLSEEFLTICEKYGKSPSEFALKGGEEFELLFTSGDDSMPESFERAGRGITRIGEIVAVEEGIAVQRDDGLAKKISLTGYEHFKS